LTPSAELQLIDEQIEPQSPPDLNAHFTVLHGRTERERQVKGCRKGKLGRGLPRLSQVANVLLPSSAIFAEIFTMAKSRQRGPSTWHRAENLSENRFQRGFSRIEDFEVHQFRSRACGLAALN